MMHWKRGLIILMTCLKWTVYKHTSPSGKVYIGITGRKPEIRWSNGHGYVGNDYFTKAIQKYGWNSFMHEILATGLSKEEAERMEIDLIAQYDSTNESKGYNISFGGSAPSTGLHWKKPEEGILRGENHPMYGRCLTPAQKQHLSELNSGERHPQYGKHPSVETKRKISEAQKGKKIPLEQIEKTRHVQFRKGHVPWNRKPVLCVETGQVFESSESAKRTFGITCIYKALQDPNKTAGGYHWQYIKKEGKRYENHLQG